MDLILVIYINVGKMDMNQAERYIDTCKKNIQDRTDDFTIFYVPTRSGETKVECINPILMDKKEYDNKVLRVLSEYQMKVDEFITTKEKKAPPKPSEYKPLIATIKKNK